MAVQKDKTNCKQEASVESQQQQAYQVLLDYLVATGIYTDVDDADREASERVNFCEQIGFYADDEQLKNASDYEKKRQALIHANDLYDIIAENDGHLPSPSNLDTSRASPTEEGDGHKTDPDDRSIEPEASEHIVPEPPAQPPAQPSAQPPAETSTRPPSKTLPGCEAEANNIPHTKQSPFLRAVLNLVKSAIVTGVILFSLTLLFSSEQQLQTIKYGLFLFASLTVLFVTLLEVPGEVWMRLRNRVGHGLFVTTASLAGLLFMQPLWNENTFTAQDGLQGLIVNPVIHDIAIIGPYWTGIAFAVMALLIFIATHTAAMPQE